jgi:chemotaxis protein CheX
MSEQAEVRIEFINPFVKATIESMTTMVNTSCDRVGLYVKKENQTTMAGDISVMMSIFGSLNGTVVISMPRKVAIKLVASMLMDEDIDDFDDDVMDGIGEIGNLIVGTAKSSISQTYGQEASISIPTILTGKPHDIQHKKGVPCIGCVFNTGAGKIAIEVAVIPDDNLKAAS